MSYLHGYNGFQICISVKGLLQIHQDPTNFKPDVLQCNLYMVLVPFNLHSYDVYGHISNAQLEKLENELCLSQLYHVYSSVNAVS